MRYYRICKTLTDVGSFIPETESIFKHIDNYNVDWYRSIYKYTEAQKAQAEEIIEIDGKIRPRGVTGIEDVTTNNLVFDFDSGTSLETAKADALKLCTRLEEMGIQKDAIQLYFSGNKGFSVEVPHDTDLTPPEFKNIVMELGKDLSSFDPKIWNPSRIFRIPFTRHQASGLYKTPLFLDEMIRIEAPMIREIAKIPCEPQLPPEWNKVELPLKIKALKKVKKEKKKMEEIHLELNFDNKPRWLSKWKYALQMGYFPNGCRSYAMNILAATYKGQGFTKDIAYSMLQAVADRQAMINGGDRYPDKDIMGTNLKSVYSDLWRGGTYVDDGFPPDLKRYLIELGIPSENQSVDESLTTVEDGLAKFAEFAATAEQNRIKFGLPEIDNNLHIQTSQLIGLLGAPGSGKTSFGLTVLNNTSLNGLSSIYFSMDMSAQMTWLKLIQRETGHYQSTIYKSYQELDIDNMQYYKNILKKNYENVNFCYRSSLSIEEMKRIIIETDEKTGIKSKLILVDYLELITTNFTDPTSSSAYSINGLREIANDLDKCVVCLLQPSKADSRPHLPIMSYYAAKGSSAIAQAVTTLITCYRPGYNREHEDNFFCVNTVKSRSGSLFKADFSWNGMRGKIATLTNDEKIILEDLRAKVKEEEDENAKKNRKGF